MKSTTRRREYWIWLALAAILLLGAALRFYRLDAQSFWNDEGNTARLVERPIPLIIAGAGSDIHPPGYYLLLHGWFKVAGNSEFALRGFSALAGILTLAVATALGRKVGGRWTALGAAFSLAIQPLAVYYSQEARMYALLSLLAALTIWFAAQFLREPRPNGLWLLLVLSSGLYTHYAYGLVILSLNAAFMISWVTVQPLRWRQFRRWILIQLLAATTFLPWLPRLSNTTSWRPPDIDASGALQELTAALLTGITLPAEQSKYLLPIAGVLLTLAIWQRSKEPFIKWCVLLLSGLPLMLITASGIYRPAYLKFLLVSSAPLAVTLALPLRERLSKKRSASNRRTALIRRGLALLLLGALWPAQLLSLHNLYFDPQYARDDYRGIAAQIAAHSAPEDAIILSAPNQWEVFTYYYQGPLTVYPAPYHPTQEVADAWTDELLSATHSQLFVLYWGDAESDPQQRLERNLAQRAYKIQEQWISDIRLAQYGTAALPTTPDEEITAQFGQDIQLTGYSLAGRSTLTPGEVIPLTLFWRSKRSLDERYKVFVHLSGSDGLPLAQADAEPVGGLHSTDNWEAGELIIDRHGILLPPDISPGTYTVKAGLYRLSGERLPVTIAGEASGDMVTLQKLEIASSK